MKKSKHFTKKLVPLFAIASATLLLTSCKGKQCKDADEFGVCPDMGAGEVLEQLHNDTMEKHTTYVLYSAYTSYVNPSRSDGGTDGVPGQTGKMREFYTGKIQSSYSGCTREHVWPCANSSNLWSHDGDHAVDSPGYKGGGSDLYHVRPVLSDVNEKRGNGKFYEFKSGENKYTYPEITTPYKITVDIETGNYANKFEPADQIKGDIARLITYLYMHYSSIGDNSKLTDTQRSYLGGLSFKDIFNSSYSQAEINAIIVKWNKNDPVSEDEKRRNDVVEAIQGNRNPFVDHPEYIDRIWGAEAE